MINKIVVNFRDVQGYSSVFRFFVNADTEAHAHTVLSAVVNGVAGLSNAAFNGGTGPGITIQSPTVYGSALPFQQIIDKAIFTFVDAAGNIHRWQVPAPKDAIFLADEQTVDPANGLVTAFVAAMTTAAAGPSFVSSRSGDQVNFFAAGIRGRRKIRRRISIFNLNTTLTGPEE